MTFRGFSPPRSNHFPIPDDWWEITAGIGSFAEYKVIMYVLRHTWGYHEFGVSKRITLDEFENGRKRRDGSRMDRGIAMSRPSVISGIRQAVADGFLTVEKNDSDPGRSVRMYGLNMASEGLNDLTPKVKEVYLSGNETLPDRLNNLTAYREYNLDMSGPEAPTESLNSKLPATGTNGRPKAGKFHIRCAEELARVVSKVVKVNHRSSTAAWAEQFRLMEEHDKVPRADIKATIVWYGEHVGGQYIPEAYSAAAFRRKYAEGKFASAMKRTGCVGTASASADVMAVDEFGRPLHPETRKLARRVREQMESDRVLGFVQQKYVDEWLAGQGLPAGRVTARMVNNT